MIEINLLPAESRHKDKKGWTLPAFGSKKIIIAASSALILPNILIPLLVQFNGLMLKRYEDIYSRMLPQVRQVDEVRNEIQGIKGLEAIASGLSGQRIILARKLNIISDCLPQGVWLSGISFSDKAFEIKGRCVSSGAQEMASVKKFLSALKTDAQFTKGLGQLELKSAQRRNIGPTEVIDFIIRSSAQAKQPAADKVKGRKKRALKK